MSISADKLRLLRRQAGAAVAAGEASTPAPAAAEAPQAVPAPANEPVFAWIEREVQHKSVANGAAQPAILAPPVPASKPSTPPRARGTDIAALRRLISLRERAVSPAPAAPRNAGRALDRHLPGTEIAPGLHLVEAFVAQAVPTAALSLAFARREDAVAPRDLLFFDTETTGLAGGTGTRAFMIGAADWHHHPVHGEGLRIRQLLMSTMAAESAMLDTFAGWLGPATVLSSYNGRCYDAPLLKTRYRLARRREPLSALDHVDLLFPTRRRYRGTWENCRLATIERQLLRIVREDDLPGSQAPAAWLHYLRGGDARDLRRVLAHNHQDVVTLALLMLRLVEAEALEQLAL
ncbi:MAG TPA: ribonuclease H-like domain-containing protein [Stenotrophomonas sp.]|nr:ribonuclease H-like domain-containing protein [Stenotrophomonas sp.]